MNTPENHEASRQPFPPQGAPQALLAEPKQRESEAQFKELMVHLHQVFWMKSAAETAVLYVSPAYEKIWGRTRESLYDNSHTFLDSIHPDDRERIADAMARKHETEGYEEEYRILRPDGTQRWISETTPSDWVGPPDISFCHTPIRHLRRISKTSRCSRNIIGGSGDTAGAIASLPEFPSALRFPAAWPTHSVIPSSTV